MQTPTSTSLETIDLYDGLCKFTLHTAPQHGHVAYVVWPCCTFALNCLVGWRVQESLVGTDSPLSLTNAAEHIEKWLQLPSAAQAFLIQRARPRRLLEKVRVVELGAGTGMLTIALHQFGLGCGVVTDSNRCVGILSKNVDECCKAGKLDCSVVAAVLSWEEYRSGGIDKLLDVAQEAFLSAHPLESNDEVDQIRLAATASDASVDVLIICECIYGTIHIGKSPLVPIIEDFLTSTRNTTTSSTRKMVLITYESRDEDIESSFWYQIKQRACLQVHSLGRKEAEPSEGNDLETTAYLLFAVTFDSSQPEMTEVVVAVDG